MESATPCLLSFRHRRVYGARFWRSAGFHWTSPPSLVWSRPDLRVDCWVSIETLLLSSPLSSDLQSQTNSNKFYKWLDLVGSGFRFLASCLVTNTTTVPPSVRAAVVVVGKICTLPPGKLHINKTIPTSSLTTETRGLNPGSGGLHDLHTNSSPY